MVVGNPGFVILKFSALLASTDGNISRHLKCRKPR